MEELDPENLGYIMIENMKMFLLRDAAHPTRAAGSKALSKLPSQKLKNSNDHIISRTYKDIKYFVLDNWRRVWILAVWLGITASLFAYKYLQYKNKAAYEVMGVCVCLAKGAAETLKFNMALILLPVCRNTITWLRNKTRLGVAVPFDSNIKFHQIITVGIAIGVGIHVMAHLACDFPRLLHTDEEKNVGDYVHHERSAPANKNDVDEKCINKKLFLMRSASNLIVGVEGVTGIIMVVLMAIAFTLASPWLRLRKVKKGKDPRANSPKDPKANSLKDQKENKGSLEKILDKLTGFNAF
ncbi:respiratory burst oxidase homolog protein C-like [Apium graveolens]|uniref:respiratory burst oxidase homolog protein C-like n=1 Tax=Apium graveolens TaxID=4045 RepID=UPI003D7A0BC0